RPSCRKYHCHPQINEFGNECGQAVIAALGPSKGYAYILTFNEAALSQALSKRRNHPRTLGRRAAAQKPNRRRSLLPSRHHPPRRRAAEARDELAPSHPSLPKAGGRVALRAPGRQHFELGKRRSAARRLLKPIRPRIGTYDPTRCTHHPRLKPRH